MIPDSTTQQQGYTVIQTQVDQIAGGGNCLILAVSKYQSIEAIQHAWNQGARHFGENYVQEAQTKIAAMAEYPASWHCIGGIQSNKTRVIAQIFDWVQSVDRPKIAQRLSEQRPEHMAPLQICVQVNFDDETQKSGCKPEQALPLLMAIDSLPRLVARGIMLIPKAQPEPLLRDTFAQARELFVHVKKHIATVDTLSMGMSGDYQLAIAEGSNMVRIGSAIFGERKHKHQ